MHHLVPLVLGDGASYGKRTLTQDILLYNAGGLFVCYLQSTTIRYLLVRSIQQSHPGVLAQFCTAQNAKGIRMTPNKKIKWCLVPPA